MLLLPTGSSQECRDAGAGTLSCIEQGTTLLSVQGAGVVPVLLLPAVLCLVPVFAPLRLVAQAAAVTVVVFCVVSALSVGLFYLPVGIVGLVLAVRRPDNADPLDQQPAPVVRPLS